MAKGNAKPTAADEKKQGTRKACGCKNDYQDGKYGKGIRVFTTGKSQRCTSCGREG